MASTVGQQMIGNSMLETEFQSNVDNCHDVETNADLSQGESKTCGCCSAMLLKYHPVLEHPTRYNQESF